ncbi:S1 family peptidase [Streptomyces sp. NBC_01275]|uniref:hypothetical protein n=1 Tax=Streptomyces sp. NBC_01275 TaxID=2903807 RepID=UPI0022519B59|nr:hypothetical protein [Streptomyces sp. NBC_01275]MCX4760402.1 S1 family peptidase [Streptomyces sp. NBC_01275]
MKHVVVIRQIDGAIESRITRSDSTVIFICRFRGKCIPRGCDRGFMSNRKRGMAIWCSSWSLVLLAGSSSVYASSEISQRPLGERQFTFASGATYQNQVDHVQARLLKYARPLRDAAEKSPEAGYSGISIDREARTVDLYWKGELPVRVRNAVEKAKRGVNVQTHRAKFSLAELDAVAVKVIGKPASQSFSSEDDAEIPSTKIVTTSSDVDGSGLTVQVLHDTSKISYRAEKTVHAHTRSSVTQTLGTNNVPIKIDFVETAPAEANVNRAPGVALGGAIIETADDKYCSTGFAVRNSAGAVRMLTARHCGAKGAAIKTATGAGLGTVETSNTANDTAIFTSTVTPRAQLHSGSWYGESSSNGAVLDVSGYSNPIVGQAVYADGAFSGESGSSQVKSSSVRWTDTENGTTYGPMFSALGGGTLAVAGKGDSGGPVFEFDDDGVNAQGTISGIGPSSATCQGEQGRLCSKEILFPGAQTIANTLGLQSFLTMS